jgi:hypothetical protein
MSSIESTLITPEDEVNLDLAMEQAQKSLLEGGVPIGSVVSSPSVTLGDRPCSRPGWMLTQPVRLFCLDCPQLYHHPTKTVLSVGHNQRVQVRSSAYSPLCRLRPVSWSCSLAPGLIFRVRLHQYKLISSRSFLSRR